MFPSAGDTAPPASLPDGAAGRRGESTPLDGAPRPASPPGPIPGPTTRATATAGGRGLEQGVTHRQGQQYTGQGHQPDQRRRPVEQRRRTVSVGSVAQHQAEVADRQHRYPGGQNESRRPVVPIHDPCATQAARITTASPQPPTTWRTDIGQNTQRTYHDGRRRRHPRLRASPTEPQRGWLPPGGSGWPARSGRRGRSSSATQANAASSTCTCQQGRSLPLVQAARLQEQAEPPTPTEIQTRRRPPAHTTALTCHSSVAHLGATVKFAACQHSNVAARIQQQPGHEQPTFPLSSECPLRPGSTLTANTCPTRSHHTRHGSSSHRPQSEGQQRPAKGFSTQDEHSPSRA